MFNTIDLRAHADREGPERAYVSLYLAGPDGLNDLNRRVENVRALLKGHAAEEEHFEETFAMVEAYLGEHRVSEPGFCLFASWADDYLEAFELERAVPDVLWVDSSPYIRPLAELQDEYENFVVVHADNTSTKVYFVTSARAAEAASVRGDVKNDVKKGGWSQKRYERRRDKELQQYTKDVAGTLETLHQEQTFDRIVLLGSEETLVALKGALPDHLQEKVAGKEHSNISDEDAMWQEAFGLFFEQERADEEALWTQIQNEYLSGGRAVVRPGNVLKAAKEGRVEKLLVTRDARIASTRCRSCEVLHAGTPDTCPACGAKDIFTVDLVNELAEWMEKTSAATEFADPIGGLTELGDVAALLRY